MSAENRWADEEAWWTLGAAEARRRMSPVCIMVFAEAVMQGPQIVAGMADSPRWDRVQITERRMAEQDEVVVLAYRARAMRRGAERDVLCSSTWLRSEGDWLMVQHQQTPVAPSPAEG